MNGKTSDMLKFLKKNHPKAWRDYLDQKTIYKKLEGGIREIENPKFIGPKKAKGGIVKKMRHGGSVKKKTKKKKY
tara:strand:+ start:361 stop:585 length:225 start_codon:yes stop_codon:yes gene_type:complete